VVEAEPKVIMDLLELEAVVVELVVLENLIVQLHHIQIVL
jgi:hypothetical protein